LNDQRTFVQKAKSTHAQKNIYASVTYSF